MKAKLLASVGLFVVASFVIYMIFDSFEARLTRTRFEKKLQEASGFITAQMIFEASRLSENGLNLSAVEFRSALGFIYDEVRPVVVSQEWSCEFAPSLARTDVTTELIEKHFQRAFREERRAIGFEIKKLRWSGNKLTVECSWLAKDFGAESTVLYSIDGSSLR